MFELSELCKMSDEALIDAVAAATREEAAAAARRLAFIAEVTSRWCDDEDEFSALALIDGWAQAKAQISAACNLGPHAANTQMRIGVALREPLPQTAAVFGAGVVSAKVIAAITWRTHLVTDPEALASIDAKIAENAHGYGVLSEAALIHAVDHWVHEFDPLAVIRSNAAARDRYLEFGDKDDPDGVVSFWGRMRATDAKITDARADEFADGVCDNDPRTKRERRADAVAAAMAGASRLTCMCGDPGCAGSGKDPRSGAVTIYVLTGQNPDAGEGAEPATVPGPDGGPEPGSVGPDRGPGDGSDEDWSAEKPARLRNARPLTHLPRSTPRPAPGPASPSTAISSSAPAHRPHQHGRHRPNHQQSSRSRCRKPIPALGPTRRLRPDDFDDVRLSRLWAPRPQGRPRPRHPLARRCHLPGQPAALLSRTSPHQDAENRLDPHRPY